MKMQSITVVATLSSEHAVSKQLVSTRKLIPCVPRSNLTTVIPGAPN